MAEQEISPKIGVIMGSHSDLVVMRHVGRALRDSGLLLHYDYEDRVISAHRTPEVMELYAQTARARRVQAIIAGAGGSAHLPGMVASGTILPVVGVAVTQSPKIMNRALGSMIGMPAGKPLATFQGPNGAYNSGLFVARMLQPKDSKSMRIGVVHDAEHAETMHHVSRAMLELGLGEGRDFEVLQYTNDEHAVDYGISAAERDFSLIIGDSFAAGAIAKATASRQFMPPIAGVVKTKKPDKMGDHLKKLINAPEGEAVATFLGTTEAYNAGLFACRILALTDPQLESVYLSYDKALKEGVRTTDEQLQQLGAEAYLALQDA